MTRGLTTDFITEIDKNAVKIALLAKAEFSAGTVRVWSGIGNITYDGEIYLGAGELLGISPVEETQLLESKNMQFTFSGIPASYVSLALGDYQNTPISLFFAVFDNNDQIIPYKLFSGRIDIMELNDSGDTATAIINAENELTVLTNSRDRYYTPEDQKATYASDLGLDFVPLIQDIEVVWG